MSVYKLTFVPADKDFARDVRANFRLECLPLVLDGDGVICAEITTLPFMTLRYTAKPTLTLWKYLRV